MKFSPIFKNIRIEKLQQYFVYHKIFSKQNFEKIKKKDFPSNDKNVSPKNTKPLSPDLFDLYRLHQIVLKFKRTTVLEFGVGWSTKIFANALLINKKKHLNDIKSLRFNNPFQVHSVDNFKTYINETKKKLSKDEKKIHL
jgi:hypothetical protein